MVKNIQSIDGFIPKSPKRHRPTLSDVPNARNFPADSAKLPKVTDGFYVGGDRPADSLPPDLTVADVVVDQNRDLMDDIEQSLDQIDDISDLGGETPTPQPSRHPKKTKKPLTPKKVIKRIFLTLLMIAILVIGYFATKTLLAGGKIFRGNPLSILTAKARLAEDKDGRTNILIFGTSGYTMSEDAWDGAMLTDSIMVLSLNQDKHDAFMVSLPRDLYVKHKCPPLGTSAGRLNETFYCAYDANKDERIGAEALMKQVGDILGLDIHYYVHADWTALVKSIDAVGGIDMTIESDDPRGIYDSSTKLRYKNGEKAHLDGQKALALARARNHNPGDYGLSAGNYDREINQQKIIAAFQKKALSAGTLLNPAAVNSLLDSIGDNLVTSFETAHVQTLIDIASQMKSSDIKGIRLVNRGDDLPDLIESFKGSDGSYLGEAPTAGTFDYSEIQAYVAQNISSNPITREAAKIDVLNGSEVAGLASKVAEQLKGDGYRVANTANAPSPISDKVRVYQLNPDKTKTAEALAKKYDVAVVDSGLGGYQTKADFIVVLGQSYADKQSER